MKDLTFEQRVRIALIRNHMVASDLAKKLEITDSYLSDILKEKRPAPEQKKRICDFLSISYEVDS